MNEASAHIRIYTFGPLSVERRLENATWEPVPLTGGKSVTHDNHVRSLLGYLLCCPQRQALRTSILNDLWPNDPLSLDEYLQRATSRLRLLLGGIPYFRRSPNHCKYHLADQSLIWIDVDHCLTLLETVKLIGPNTPEGIASLEDAAYYFRRGPFLEEETGIWVHGPKEHLRSCWYDCRLSLATAYQARGQCALAQQVAEDLLRANPLDENALGHLMAALHTRGMTIEALRRYRETVALAKKQHFILSATLEKLAQQLQDEPCRLSITAALGLSATANQREHSGPVNSASTTNLAAQDIIQEDVSKDGLETHSFPIPSSDLAHEESEEACVGDMVTWFLIRANELKGLASSWAGLTLREHSAKVLSELESWHTMTKQDQQAAYDFRLTRRAMLGSLALLSTPLLMQVRAGRLTALLAEEFLHQCATSIMACDQLLKGDGLVIVEYTLPQYLPHLVKLAMAPSPALQKEAAYLASQGCCLMSTIKFHRLQFRERMAYSKQAVSLARVTDDNLLLAATLTRLAAAYFYDNQLQKYLETCQATEHLLERAKEQVPFPPRLQSRIYIQLSNAHACLAHKEAAQYYLGLANATPFSPDDTHFIPALDYDLSHKIGVEGKIHINLGKLADKIPSPDQARSHYEDADSIFGAVEQIFQSTGLVERVRLETINQRQLVAVKLGDMEQFEFYLKKGAEGAKALGSQKRLDEAVKNWRAARKRWPNEKRVMDLDEWLF